MGSSGLASHIVSMQDRLGTTNMAAGMQRGSHALEGRESVLPCPREAPREAQLVQQQKL